MTIVMGLDQHRAQITAEWLDTETGEITHKRISPAHRDDVRQFCEPFRGQELEVGLEATTGWRFVADELAAVGAVVHLAEPAETAARRGTKKRAKSDRADARALPRRRSRTTDVGSTKTTNTSVPLHRTAGRWSTRAPSSASRRWATNRSTRPLQTLARILDEAEDGDWIDRNPARGRRMREPRERRRRAGALDLDEFQSLLEAAAELDRTRHSPRTLERAEAVRALRDHARLEWKAVAKRLKVAPSTAHYLYSCRDYEGETLVVGQRRAVIVTLGLAGPRVSELCELDNQDVDLARTRLVVKDSKTEAGVRDIDIHQRLLSELRIYRAQLPTGEMDDPAFPTRTGTRRTKDNVGSRVVATVVKRANEIRASRKQPPIHVHVTPHTFRRTYATYMLAAGHDVPYVQHQLGDVDPTITLSIYTQLMRRADREQLRQELRSFIDTPVAKAASTTSPATGLVPDTTGPGSLTPAPIDGLRRIEKAEKGRTTAL
jgi:integrase